MSQITLQKRGAQSSLDLSDLAKQALQPWADAYQPWADAYETWRSGTSDLLERSSPTKTKRTTTTTKCDCGCQGCSKCDRDPCECRCCVNDSDLVLETRLGERRIVTLVIENHWRRERRIELELSSWTTSLAGVTVNAAILSPVDFTLPPCGEEQVILSVAVEAAGEREERRLPDVHQCAVSYADLRIKGCDLRSIRLAVAVLPRDCDAYKVDCACGCC